MKIFLSHSSEDSETARAIAKELRGVGKHDVWLALDSLKGGDHWMKAIETAIEEAEIFLVYVGSTGIQRFVDIEVRTAISRQASDSNFRIVPALGPDVTIESLLPFLRQFHSIKFESPAQACREIAQLESKILKPEGHFSFLDENQAPFQGLNAFDARSAHLFFGRDQEIFELINAMCTDNFLTIVGDSGSGKSSLIMAGLIPALHCGRFRSSKCPEHDWRIMSIKPGSAPLHALAWGLNELNPNLETLERVKLPETFREALTKGESGLLDCIHAVTDPGDNILIVVDQFEEIFTLTTNNEQRNKFIDSLLYATNTYARNKIYVIITIRADFYSKCWTHPELPKRIAKNQFAAQRMKAEQLREVIEKPLSVAGARTDKGLVDTILNEVGDEPGHLPLLEFTLYLLWEKQHNNLLTFSDYTEIGRLRGALGTYADGVYNALSDNHKSIAKKVFLTLTHIGEGTEDTRRRVSKTEILDIRSDNQQIEALLNILISARLVAASREKSISTLDQSVGRVMLEVSHEALIREWPKLKGWLDESRDEMRIQRKFFDSELDWRQHNKDSSYLYPAGRLAEVEEWALVNPDDLTSKLDNFLAESVAERERQKAEALRAKRMIERLTDEKTVRDLEEATEELWPAYPHLISRFEVWLEQAYDVLSRRDGHDAKLRAIIELNESESTCAENETEAWWHDALQDLVKRLDNFGDYDSGVVFGTHNQLGIGIEKRLSFARKVAAATVDEESVRNKWSKAINSIADTVECPMYLGLQLKSQLGLVPLGIDKSSGLWEFAHVQTGEIPTKDPLTNQIALKPENSLVFVLIPPGTFLMGAHMDKSEKSNFDPNGDRSDISEEPVHQVELDAFFLSKFEMTQGQWEYFTGRNPSHWNPNYKPNDVTLLHPVEQVTWEDCDKILHRLDLSFPTEAQWEYACRAQTNTIFWFGNIDSNISKYANVTIDKSAENQKFRQAPTTDLGVYHNPVNAYPANKFGLHDMHGNLWEWCQDGIAPYSNETKQGNGLRKGADDCRKCLRGGSFVNAVSDAGASRRLFRPTDYPN